MYITPVSDSPDMIKLSEENLFSRTVFPLHPFSIKQDFSVLPSSLSNPRTLDIWCYIGGEDREERIKKNEKIIKGLRFSGSEDSVVYTETKTKIDYVLPQIYTVVSLMMVVVKVLSSHFRRWAIKI